MDDFSRRRFVQLAGAAGAATAFGAGTVDAAPGTAISAAIAESEIRLLPNNYALFLRGYVRRNVSNMAAGDPDLVAYAAAVTAMKALPLSDPRNWTKQAQIHLNFCPHGNWFFLPWHRAYLLYFEQICRDLSGYAAFTLPYWDWTNHGKIPAPFWSGSLNDANRSINSSTSVDPTGAFCGQPVIDTIMGYTDFEQFASYKSTATRGGVGGGQGTLEASPHNHVHGAIGGDMGTYMSPLDPIFWLHHANIDRIWAMWNLTKANTTDPVWVNYTYPNVFVDKNKTPQSLIVKNMRSTYQNSYRYDTQPNQFLYNIAALQYRYIDAVQLSGVHRLTAVDRTPASLSIATSAAFRDRTARLLAAPVNAKPSSVILTLRGVKAPADQRTSLRVFINLPGANADTPITDPHYAGSIAFFSGDMAGMSMSMDYNLDITKTLAAIGGGSAAAIQPQLVAIGEKGAAQARTAITAERFDVGIREAL